MHSIAVFFFISAAYKFKVALCRRLNYQIISIANKSFSDVFRGWQAHYMIDI